ncbi:MAG: septum formation initiator family protein [Melioribacteraceae bacterium]|nr:septum formation initiator family protein [Melioribacteraceae bacterium]
MSKSQNKLLFRVIIGLVIISITAFLFFNENGVLKYLSLKSELNELDLKIKSAEEKLKTLEAEIDSLNSSNAKMERVARERYHMMLPNERVLKVEEN